MKQLNPAPIGIDLGSYKSKIAVAKRGGVQIITNDANFRQTPCVVGYGPMQRNIGQSGFIKMKSNFKDTIVAPQRFIGLSNEYPQLKSQIKYNLAKCDINTGKLLFQVNYQGQKQNILPQQALAAYFNKLKQIINHNQLQSKQAVIAVPSYLTQIQRKGILNSARIAQLTVTRLINQSTAISLDYGIFRKADLDIKIPRNVLFLDFGHCHFSIFCSSFTKQQMNVLYQNFSRNLGCRDLDYEIFQFYKKIFVKSSGGCDLSQNRKAIVKLMQNIQKQRKILSGINQFQMNVEYLMEQNDLHYLMKREQFNTINKNIFNKIQQLQTNARQYLKEKSIQIHSVQLVGGGSRIPQFIKIAKEVFGHQPSRTLNLSQTVARGSALMAAIKSPLFRVAQYTLNQKAVYGIKFSWNFVQGNQLLGINSANYPQKQKKMIFEGGCKVPSSKTIKFTRKQAIQMVLQYQPQIPGFKKNIGYYLTKSQQPKQQIFAVQFKLKYTEDGLIVFSDCALIQQWTQQTKIPKKKQQKPIDKKPQTQPTTQQSQTTAPPSTDQSPVPSPPIQQQFQIKKTKKQKATQIKYESNTFDIYGDKQLNQFFSIQSTMCNQDRILLQTYQKKNQLQSLAYNWKQRLNGTHKSYVKPQSIQNIINYLQETSNWLYNEGQNSNRGTYNKKIQQVLNKVNDTQKLYENYQDIANQFIKLQQALKSNFQLCNSLDKKYEHITPQQRQPILTEIQSINQWMIDTTKQLQQRPKYENPIISSNDIKQKIKDINNKTKNLMNKPLPKKQQTKTNNEQSNKMDQEKPANSDSSTKMEEEKK